MSTMTRTEAAALLGVAETANADEIAAAWRATAKTTHPDMGGDAEQFRRLSIAAELMQTAEAADEPAEALPIPVVKAHLEARIDVRRAVVSLAATLVVIAVVIAGAAPASIVVVPIVLTAVTTVSWLLWVSCGRPSARTAVDLARRVRSSRDT